MNHPVQVILAVVLVSATSLWVGGYVAIGVVARTAAHTLDAGQRVAFFRSLGRSYLKVGTPALVVALASGAVLVRDHTWDGTLIAALVVAAALLASLWIGVAQARAMTRLRHGALGAPDDPANREAIQRGARLATGVRASIGVLTLTLVVLGCVLAT